jgi:hypothetical protein
LKSFDWKNIKLNPKIPRQIISLAIIFAIAIAAFVIGRMLFVPRSFGKYGHYRGNALDEIASQKINYAGYQVCTNCHSNIYNSLTKSNHKGVSCETCHGPAAKHTGSPGEYKPIVPREREHCQLCHAFNPSRPTGFPQIIAETHNPGKACMACHEPHNPLVPQVISECSACHRTIANQKRVSHHASLSCEQCHKVTEKHLTNPKLEKAGKPVERAFCGQCHAKDADSLKEIRRIDLSTHGGRYLCWECHYPHYPEAKR